MGGYIRENICNWQFSRYSIKFYGCKGPVSATFKRYFMRK
jgi:hypothetical protein